MEESGFTSGTTIGGKWGYALSALIGIPLLGLSIMASTLGDCLPDQSCSHSLIWWLVIRSIGVAALVGLASRALINRAAARRRNSR